MGEFFIEQKYISSMGNKKEACASLIPVTHGM